MNNLFRKKPFTIEAIQYDGQNEDVIKEFAKGSAFMQPNSRLVIFTLEGEMLCGVGDWIIKGVNGEFYPCKPDIFIKSYDEVICEN